MSSYDSKKYPLGDIQGKAYMGVATRVLWFRDDHPKGRISTEIISHDPILVKATICDADGLVLATGHAGATNNNIIKGRLVEKAETAAIGRALGLAGYGTQFADDELDDSDNLSDSPQERRPPSQNAPQAPSSRVGAFTHNSVGWATVKRDTLPLFDGNEFAQNTVITRGFEQGWLHEDLSIAAAIASVTTNRVVKEAHWTSDASAVEKFVSWATGWVEHKTDVVTALKQSVEYPFKKIEDYRGSKPEAMAAVAAYFCDYDKARIQPAVSASVDVPDSLKAQVTMMAIALCDKRPLFAVAPKPIASNGAGK